MVPGTFIGSGIMKGMGASQGGVLQVGVAIGARVEQGDMTVFQ
jgi:hypothetical protein